MFSLICNISFDLPTHLWYFQIGPQMMTKWKNWHQFSIALAITIFFWKCPVRCSNVSSTNHQLTLKLYHWSSVNGNFIHQPPNVETYSIGHNSNSSQFFQKQRIYPRMCLNVPHVQIWRKIPKRRVLNGRWEIATRNVIEWFKCKLKPPKMLD